MRTILVDMDGVLANFEKGLLDEFRRRCPNKLYIPLNERTTFHARDQYPEDSRQVLREIIKSKGFYRNLEPIAGALEAIKEISSDNLVFICTSPANDYENCVGEKFWWVEERLGREWTKRIVLTNDKTIVRGDYLIDDKPVVAGALVPDWEQIIYTQPYNARINDSRKRMDWTNWRSVLCQD